MIWYIVMFVYGETLFKYMLVFCQTTSCVGVVLWKTSLLLLDTKHDFVFNFLGQLYFEDTQ